MRGIKRRLEEGAVDAAIAANAQPRAPAGGRGLLLGVPGGRARKLMTATGALTPTGEYYYSRLAQEAPRHALDYAQQPERRGNRTSVKLLDGRKAIVRSWDPVRSEWRYTKLGRDFYKDSVDRYVVTFPV